PCSRHLCPGGCKRRRRLLKPLHHTHTHTHTHPCQKARVHPRRHLTSAESKYVMIHSICQNDSILQALKTEPCKPTVRSFTTPLHNASPLSGTECSTNSLP